MTIRVRGFFILMLALLIGVALAFLPTSPARAKSATVHFITNLHGSTAPAALGYNVFDTSASGVAYLPSGVRGLVWLGQKCPTYADSTFKATIDKLATNSKVFGYYLSDEPHISSCPGGPSALKSRVNYIHSKTSTQKTFIVLSKQADFAPFAPAKTNVDLVGLDPYPCSIANPTCDISKIAERIGWADKAYIPRAKLVPVFQAFGQEKTTSHYYNLPTATQMQAMLNKWHYYLPAPVMDYTYTWGHQTMSNPTLVDSSSLQSVMKAHNAL